MRVLSLWVWSMGGFGRGEFIGGLVHGWVRSIVVFSLWAGLVHGWVWSTGGLCSSPWVVLVHGRVWSMCGFGTWVHWVHGLVWSMDGTNELPRMVQFCTVG